jgi:hypothetical protein
MRTEAPLRRVTSLPRPRTRSQCVAGAPFVDGPRTPGRSTVEGSDMSKVRASHTTSDEYSDDHRTVYHDNNKCGYGAEIKPEHRVPGTGGRARCDRCGDLAEAQQ